MYFRVIFVTKSMTEGKPLKLILQFAVPLLLGNLLQQMYNLVDAAIVGRVLGTGALAAVGATSSVQFLVLGFCIGICIGFGIPIAKSFGAERLDKMRSYIFNSVLLTALFAVLITAVCSLCCTLILQMLSVPQDVFDDAYAYLIVIFLGIPFTLLYNLLSSILRSVGDSRTPFLFLAISTVLNIGLDLLCIIVFKWGVAGAAWATVIAQYFSGLGLAVFTLRRCPDLLPKREELRFDAALLREIFSLSSLTCVQQSVMNFGILMVQGLVNSFGETVMAAFAAAVKIDTFAYLPVQDFGNAYSTFTAQNYGAGNHERIRRGTKDAFALSAAFSIVISLLVNLFAHPLMQIFVKASEMEVIAIGVQYLRLEGSFYLGIGWLFLLYGYYRAVKRAEMSVVLTVISLGMRVALAYLFSATALGVAGIWIAIPIGWALADMTGLFFLRRAFRSQKPA